MTSGSGLGPGWYLREEFTVMTRKAHCFLWPQMVSQCPVCSSLHNPCSPGLLWSRGSQVSSFCLSFPAGPDDAKEVARRFPDCPCRSTVPFSSCPAPSRWPLSRLLPASPCSVRRAGLNPGLMPGRRVRCSQAAPQHTVPLSALSSLLAVRSALRGECLIVRKGGRKASVPGFCG